MQHQQSHATRHATSVVRAPSRRPPLPLPLPLRERHIVAWRRFTLLAEVGVRAQEGVAMGAHPVSRTCYVLRVLAGPSLAQRAPDGLQLRVAGDTLQHESRRQHVAEAQRHERAGRQRHQQARPHRRGRHFAAPGGARERAPRRRRRRSSSAVRTLLPHRLVDGARDEPGVRRLAEEGRAGDR